MKRTRLFQAWLLSWGMVLGLAGCGGQPDSADAEYAALLEYVVPDLRVPEAIWRAAPASCDDQLFDDGVKLGHAEGAPSLGVVLDEAGVALCVDTWMGIRLELQRVKGDPSPDPMRPVIEDRVGVPGEE